MAGRPKDRLLAIANEMSEPEAAKFEEMCARIANQYGLQCFREAAAIVHAARYLRAAR
jgi:hypothetical protein